jgi:hypothetical protein
MGIGKPVYSCYLVGEDELNYFTVSKGIDESINGRLKDYRLLMFSSAALWFLVALKLFHGKKILWTSLLQELNEVGKNYMILADAECLELIKRNAI